MSTPPRNIAICQRGDGREATLGDVQDGQLLLAVVPERSLAVGPDVGTELDVDDPLVDAVCIDVSPGGRVPGS